MANNKKKTLKIKVFKRTCRSTLFPVTSCWWFGLKFSSKKSLLLHYCALYFWGVSLLLVCTVLFKAATLYHAPVIPHPTEVFITDNLSKYSCVNLRRAWVRSLFWSLNWSNCRKNGQSTKALYTVQIILPNHKLQGRYFCYPDPWSALVTFSKISPSDKMFLTATPEKVSVKSY